MPISPSLAKDLMTTQKWLLELPWKLHILRRGKSFMLCDAVIYNKKYINHSRLAVGCISTGDNTV